MDHTETTGTTDAGSAGAGRSSRLQAAEGWALLDAAPDGLLLADESGRILLANSRIEELFGYDRSELLGRPVEDLLPERFRKVHRAHRTRYRVDPRPRAMGSAAELSALRRDGSEFRVEVSLSPVELADGLAVAASVRDISERVALEAQTHAVLEIIDATRDAVLMFAPDTLALAYVNQGAVLQLGYERDDLLAMTPLHLLPGYTRSSFEALLAPLLDDRQRRAVVTTELCRRDGGDVPVEVSFEYPPAAGPDRPRLVVAVARDITERIEQARALSSSEAAFQAAFDDAPVAMVIASVESGELHPLRVNDAVSKLLGYSGDELIGRSLTALSHPDELERDRQAYAAMADDGLDGYETEKRYRHADGHDVWVWLHSTVLPDPADGGAKVLAHLVDLRERREAEEERRRNQRRVQCLADVRAAALTGRPLAESLELVCRHARGLIGADGVAMLREAAGGTSLRVVAVDASANRALVPEEIEVDDLVRGVLAGESFVSTVAADEPQLGRAVKDAMAQAGQTAIMAARIALSERSSAVLVLTSGRGECFDARHVAELEAFVAEAANAVQLHQARLDTTRLKILEDRERLGQDLHDVVIQRLFAAGMGLQSVQPLVVDERAAERIAQVVGQLDESIAELRAAIFHLHEPQPSPTLDRLELVVEDAVPHLGFRPLLEIEGDPAEISEEIVDEVVPVLTEALSNIARHAEAARAHIRVEVQGRGLRLTVADDGVGIHPDAPRGNGIDNLEARANRVGGTAWVTPGTDGGTVVTWTAGD